MLHHEKKPSRGLANHLECYWQVEGSSAQGRQCGFLLAPECTLDILFCDRELILEFGASPSGAHCLLQPGGWIIGQKTQSCRLTMPADASVFGIRIKPFAIPCFAPLPPAEFRNMPLPLSSLVAGRHRQCIEELCNQRIFPVRVESAEWLVTEILAVTGEFSPLMRAQVNYVLDRRGNLQLKQLQERFGASRPSLCSQFMEQVGLLPKEFSKIWRLNHFQLLQARHPGRNHAELSLQAGYYDQSHLINDFTAVFGQPPARYFRRESPPFDWCVQSIERRFNDQYPAVS